MKLKFYIALCVSFSLNGMNYLPGWLKKKPKVEVPQPVHQDSPEVAQKAFWDILKGGASKEAADKIDKAAEKLTKAMPGVTIEVIIINQVNNNDQTNTTYVGAFDPKNIKNYKNMLAQGQEKINVGFKSLSEYLLNNKRKFFNILGVSAYLTVQLTLISIKQKLRSTVCWSKWNTENELEQLSDSLLGEIQLSYCDVSHPSDFITPLMCFIEDVENEKYYLEKYQQIIRLLEQLWLNRLFLYDAKLYNAAQERIEKLALMKKRFTRWVSNFKIQQVQNNTQHKVLGIEKD